MLGVIPFTAAVNVTTVYADDEVITDPVESPTEEAAVEEAVEEPVESPAEEAPAEEAAEEPVETEAVEPVDEASEAEEPEEETEAADVTEEAVEISEENALTDPEPVEPEAGEDLSELVEVLSEAEAQITDVNGEALPLAGKEAAEVLVNGDPFFWDGNEWVGYTKTGTGCPVNVTCKSSTLLGMGPFEAAVAHATSANKGKMIYVAGGDYQDEDIVVNYEGLSFTAFHTITVPDAHNPTLPTYSSGYALLNSITLNVNFGSTEGVYANSIIVNGAGTDDGRLEDGLALVNAGGTVEADMIIYRSGDHYRVKDANHPIIIPEVNDFEWECGEPNLYIYTGESNIYRMILKDPSHQDILDYYTTHGDERRLGYSGPYLDLSAVERMEDLLIGVNRSEDYSPPSWSNKDEEQIYWYLVGNTGKDANNFNITPLSDPRQEIANKITDGDYNDNITNFWNIWFLWPTSHNGNVVSPGDGSSTDKNSSDKRQLTFFVYDPRPVYGCTDPESLNYDPNATEDDESCRYENTIIVPPSSAAPADPAAPPAPLPIPVTGEIEELFLIPVTGVDPMDINGIGLMEVALLMSVMVLGAGFIILKTKKQKEH
jgi:hypothetical protein